MKSLSKKSKKLIYIPILFICITVIFLFFSGCNLFNKISGNNESGELPSFSGSGITITDLNSGNIYPGESLEVNVNIVNSGNAEAKNIKARLILPDLFILNEGEPEWTINNLDAGEEISFKTSLDLIENITEDIQVSLELEISSDEVDSFTGPDYSITVYAARQFDGTYIPIIGLHAIEDHIGEAIELSTGYFDKLCGTLKEYGYETITFKDLLNYIDFGKALPEKPVIITSDDGYQDIYVNGFPILKKYGYKMTVFLVTGAIGNSDADRKTNKYFNERASVIRPILTWPEIIEMDEYGCEFLSHTVNHVRLGLASDEEFLNELTQSRKDIESHLDKEVLFFAWPYDNNSPSKWPLIPEAGYRGAVRYGNGIEDMRTINLYDIKRVEFNSYIPPGQYAGYLKLDRSITIDYKIDDQIKKTGEEFTLEYIIKSTNKNDVKIDSLELELPDNIEFIGVDPAGYFNQYPGISEGIYMWVSDSYSIKGEGEINLILKLEGTDSGESVIKFRAAYNGSYIGSDDIGMEIKNR